MIFGPLPLLHLTVAFIEMVAYLFKVGTYVLYPMYLPRVKQEHIVAGFLWSDQLPQEANASVRVVTGGLGPARQSHLAPFTLFDGNKYGWQFVVPRGPVHRYLCVVFGCLFMLREIEVSLPPIQKCQDL